MPGIPSAIPTRPLGSTGVSLPILGLGGGHVARAGSEAAARALVETALEEGIRFLDTAESYGQGDSERWLGAALAAAGARDEVFLMTKTLDLERRSGESARRQLGESLERLRTDRLDLWQLHSVRTPEDVDRAFAPGGAFEVILDAKARGLTRFVGVTGHQHPAANRRAIAWWDRGFRFDTMQMPLNPLDPHQLSFEREVLPELVSRGIGAIAMKTAAEGKLLTEGICTADECHRYAWSLPVSLAVVGMETPALVRENARHARELVPMSNEERSALLARTGRRVELGLERYKRAL